MKKLFFILCLLNLSVKAQITYSVGPLITTIPAKDEQKPSYTHVIIYRKWENYLKQYGDAASIEYHWETKSQFCKSEKEAVEYINTNHSWGGGNSDNYVSITEDELIGIYDLTTAKEIKVKFIEEKKSKPKRVEIQEEKWVEQHYEIIK